MIFFSNKQRPFHYSYFPLERLQRDDGIAKEEREAASNPCPSSRPRTNNTYSLAVDKYHDIFKAFCRGDKAAAEAPVPGDLERRMIDIKGAGYFLDASQIGICELSDSCWYQGATK